VCCRCVIAVGGVVGGVDMMPHMCVAVVLLLLVVLLVVWI